MHSGCYVMQASSEECRPGLRSDDAVTELGYTRDQLLNPAVNLLVGRLIALEAEKLGWCTFQPWHMSGGYGC